MKRLMMAKGESSVRAIGDRLRVTREALGLNQVKFCRPAGISPSAYNQVEKGKTRPSIDAAIALCEAYRLTLDWIYRGDNSGLRASLSDAIRALRQTRE